MRPRMLFAAPVLLVVWLASGRTGPPARAVSTAARYDPSETPTSQPDRGSSYVANGVRQPDPTRTPAAPQTARRSEAAPPDSDFAATVRPILLSHCTPCHEPGGKMYDRLPFDRAETIAAHREGVLRRIKAPDEKAAIEKWLAKNGS